MPLSIIEPAAEFDSSAAAGKMPVTTKAGSELRRLGNNELRSAAGELLQAIADSGTSRTVANSLNGASRLKDSQRLLEELRDDPCLSDDYYGAFSGKRPAGLMALGEPKREDGWGLAYIEILTLVTDPGIRGIGGELIERAMHVSEESGCGGVVRVTSLTGSTAAYQRLGFRDLDTGDNVLELTPERWHLCRGTPTPSAETQHT